MVAMAVAALLSGAGIVAASNVEVLPAQAEPARLLEPLMGAQPEALPQMIVIVDPICAFDGSGCMTPEAQPATLAGQPESAPTATPQAQTAEPAEPQGGS
jgi:hypothetical protein